MPARGVPNVAPGPDGSPHISDHRRITIRHITGVHEDVGTLQEPKAGSRLVGTAMEILQPVATRFNDIDDVDRKKHIEARVDILLLDGQMKSIFSMLQTDPQSGVTKQSCDWQRQIVFAALVELRSIRISLDIANTNEAFEDWDSLAAKTTASEKRIDETSLKTIGEGAGLSKGSRMAISQKAIANHINKKGENLVAKGNSVEKSVKQDVAPKPDGQARSDRTQGATCSFCGKGNHTDVQCHVKKREAAREKEQTRHRRSRSPNRNRRDRSPSRRHRSASRDRKDRRKDDHQPPPRTDPSRVKKE